MSALKRALAVLAIGLFARAGAQEGPPPVKIERVATRELPRGTHRPELIVAPDGGFLLAAVDPQDPHGGGGKRVKHRVYRFDAGFRPAGDPFPVTWTTEEYGEPADHRAVLVREEIVLVYQCLRLDRDGPPAGGGPMERFARDQSLLVARYSLDGRELSRSAIVANAPRGSGENFPDHCLAWTGERLLVSTGTGERRAKIREVSLEGKILAEREYPCGRDGLASEIGNSFLPRPDGWELLCGSGPGRESSLTIHRFDAEGALAGSCELPASGREETFPTGNLVLGDFTLIAYISRAPGGDPGPETDPYRPWLKVLDREGKVVADLEIGGDGMAHVHPTLACSGERIFYAWSRRVDAGGRRATPQVVVEELRLVLEESK